MPHRDVPDAVRAAIGLAVAVVALALLAGSAGAAPTEITGCDPITDPGTYVLTGDLDDGSLGTCIDVRTSDVVIDGNGYTLNNTGGNRDGITVSGQHDGGTNVTVRNLTLTNWNKALLFQSDPEVTVSDVHVDGAHTGVDATGTVDVSSSSFVNVTSKGISASQDTEATIRNVTVVSDDDGMLLSGPVTVEDSDVTAGSGDTGITILDVSNYQSTFDATVRNTSLSAGWRGIQISDGVNATLHNNTVVGGNWAGIAIDYDSLSGDGPVAATVTENTIEDAEVGVFVEATNRTELAETTIVGNDISNGTVGVQINRGRYATDSTYYDSQWSADVNLVYEVRDNVIRTVEPDGPEDQGLRIEGAVGTIVGNDVNSTWDAISLHEADATLRENVVRAEKRYGVGVRMGSTVTLDGDSIRAEPPVSVTDSSLATTDVDIDANGSVYTAIGATNSTVTVTGGTITNGSGAFAAVTGNSLLITDREPSVVTVEGVTVTNVTNTTVIEGSSLSITDSTFRGESTEGFISASNGTLSLSNVSIEPGAGKQMTTAVWGESGSDVTVSESTILGAETGVLVLDSNGTLVGNTIWNASTHAVSATNASVAVEGNAIYNATTSSSYNGAIHLRNASGIVADNAIESNWYGVESIASGAAIEGNVIDSVLYGVDYSRSWGPIVNNTANGGLYIAGSVFAEPTEVLVEGNVIDVEGFRSGISVWSNVEVQIRNNEITSEHKGVRAELATGATVSGNTITIAANDYEESAGVWIGDSSSTANRDGIEPIEVLGNEIVGETGVQIGENVYTNRELTVVGNDLSATEVAVHNLNETVVEVPLNYYSPRGPTDHEFVGPVAYVEPFLTERFDPRDGVAITDVQSFAYDLDFEPGRTYAFGTPATLETTLAETFGDFDGAIYLYDESSDSWQLATGDETLAAMDAVVVVPTTDARAVVNFADATPSYPENREVEAGWNFVAPRHYDAAEGAFSTQTVAATDVLDVYWQPDDQPMQPGDNFGHYAFATGSGGDSISVDDYGYSPRVSPFAGYFVYATEPGTIPGVVPNGVTALKIEQLLDESGGV